MTQASKPPPERLSAWLDGELEPAAQAEVDAWLRDHPEDAAQVRLWAADRDALRARLAPLADEPVPAALAELVRRGGRGGAAPAAASAVGAAAGGAAAKPPAGGVRRVADLRRWPAWAQAAALAGLFVLGGASGAALVWWHPPAQRALLSQAARSGWIQRAAVAHAVYAPEVRHPVEVNVVEGDLAAQRAQEQHLSRWLGKRLDMPVPLFDLRGQGFQLVGGRLLPDANGPSAQLMYQNSAGQRVTVYLRRPEPGVHTAFSWRREAGLGVFYWLEEGYGCALVGDLPRAQLLALAEAVYRQADEAPAAAPAAPHGVPGAAPRSAAPGPRLSS